MPTKRRRMFRNRLPDIPPPVIEYLRTGKPDDSFEVFEIQIDGPRLRASWTAVRDDVLADCVRDRPGTRPWAWWEFDAPRWQRLDMPERWRTLGNVYVDRFCEPRHRLGGVGSPRFEYQAWTPRFRFGVPTDFLANFDIDVALGEAVNVQGEPILRDLARPGFLGAAIDPHDPPRFEAQAVYLQRHALLLPGEAGRLTARDFEPEMVHARTEA